MNLTYKRATLEDIDILVKTRIEVLKAANKLCVDTDMGEVERQSYSYYQKALCDGSHIAYLVFNGSCCIGTGGVSFFQVMPTYHNPSGKKAYIMNMYTNPNPDKPEKLFLFSTPCVILKKKGVFICYSLINTLIKFMASLPVMTA